MPSTMQQLKTTTAFALDGAGGLVRRAAHALKRQFPHVGDAPETARPRLARACEVEAWIAETQGTAFRLVAVPGGSWRVTFVSPAILEMTGFTEEEARRPGFRRAHIESPELESLQRQLHAALEFGEASAEFPFIHRDGRRRLFHASLRGAATAHGGGEVVMIWTDMTRELEMQSQLGQSAKLATLGTLATSIAHELNQPLATISMAAERVSRELSRLPDLDPQLAQALNRISDQAMRASGIIERMLNFGRINSGSAEAVSVGSAIENVEVLITSKLRSCAARLEIDLPAGLPDILARAVPLEQVLVNLLVNACDASAMCVSRPGPDARLIRLSAMTSGDHVILAVYDQAGGIPHDVLPRIFQPFFTTKAAGQGTGLGLSISRRLIEEMGGTLTAENRDGGACFTICLPAVGLPAAGDARPRARQETC